MAEDFYAIVHTPTRELAAELMDRLSSEGFARTEKFLEYWEREKEETCYRITVTATGLKSLNRSSLSGYRRNRADWSFVPNRNFCISVEEFLCEYFGETPGEIEPADSDAVAKLLFG